MIEDVLPSFEVMHKDSLILGCPKDSFLTSGTGNNALPISGYSNECG